MPYIPLQTPTTCVSCQWVIPAEEYVIHRLVDSKGTLPYCRGCLDWLDWLDHEGVDETNGHPIMTGYPSPPEEDTTWTPHAQAVSTALFTLRDRVDEGLKADATGAPPRVVRGRRSSRGLLWIYDDRLEVVATLAGFVLGDPQTPTWMIRSRNPSSDFPVWDTYIHDLSSSRMFTYEALTAVLTLLRQAMRPESNAQRGKRHPEHNFQIRKLATGLLDRLRQRALPIDEIADGLEAGTIDLLETLGLVEFDIVTMEYNISYVGHYAIHNVIERRNRDD